MYSENLTVDVKISNYIQLFDNLTLSFEKDCPSVNGISNLLVNISETFVLLPIFSFVNLKISICTFPFLTR